MMRNSYVLLFVWTLAEQLGLPLPAAPVLLVAGALAAAEKISFAVALVLALGAALVGDLAWYELGHRRGSRITRLICRISLAPDSCARRTENLFARYGAPSLLLAKFIPGLNTAAPSLSGVFGMRRWRFVLFDGLGALLWAITYLGLGFLFANQIEQIWKHAIELGPGFIVVVLFAALGAWVLRKYLGRQHLLKQLRMERISPEELKRKLDAGEPVTILDARHPLDLFTFSNVLPGAKRIRLEQLDPQLADIPKDHDVVVYCTCPNEASSVQAALLLKSRGVSRVRPLAGGYATWIEHRYPVEPFNFSEASRTDLLRPVWSF